LGKVLRTEWHFPKNIGFYLIRDPKKLFERLIWCGRSPHQINLSNNFLVLAFFERVTQIGDEIPDAADTFGDIWLVDQQSFSNSFMVRVHAP
jgi:hypothetical protein